MQNRSQSSDRIVAVGLLTESDLSMLGDGFRRAYRLEDQHDFECLLHQIDEAERAYRQAR